MKIKVAISIVLLCVSIVSCAQLSKSMKIPKGDPAAIKGEAVAYFSEGCFWHTEIVFQSLYGVRDAVSGYSGGTTSSPDYEKISDGSTGHAETVKVFYDPAKISFSTLTDAFFASHDPTQVNGQGYDVGTQYRSIAFYSNDAEKKVIENAIRKLQEQKKYKKKIATQVIQFTKFYSAENYHQEYIINHPGSSYVQNVSIPDYLEFRLTFKGKFKEL